MIEVDGREKRVDTYYYGKKTGQARPPLMYWGKYVQHDNNRDGMGQYPEAHAEHHRGHARMASHHPARSARSAVLSYMSPPAPGRTTIRSIRIQIDEWWLLAETEVMEMAKRGVPGVWTYGFYDGWVPNYLFWIAHHAQFVRPFL